MVLENYVPQISFAITAIVCVFLSEYLFKGGKDWAKKFIMKHRFSPRKEGFLFFFLIVVLIIPAIAIGFQRFFSDLLVMQRANVDVIVIAMMIAFYFYFNRKFYKRWF